jgi:hypothetical protein
LYTTDENSFKHARVLAESFEQAYGKLPYMHLVMIKKGTCRMIGLRIVSKINRRCRKLSEVGPERGKNYTVYIENLAVIAKATYLQTRSIGWSQYALFEKNGVHFAVLVIDELYLVA